LVVSWKEAADIQLVTPREAFVIPNKVGPEVADFESRNSTSFLSLRRRMVTLQKQVLHYLMDRFLLRIFYLSRDRLL
jgi:hypothetical protein